MSDAEEFQAVDVPELDKEEALSDDDIVPKLGDDPVQGRWPDSPSCLSIVEELRRSVLGTSFVSGTITTSSVGSSTLSEPSHPGDSRP
jgi:hypothetical protein